MTSVVGILNKKGVALAADSAVTRDRERVGKSVKVTKNGNKMIRLSDSVHICTMVTGSGDFLCNPWDIVIRRYRQDNGKIRHKTVEDAVRDFFGYLAAHPVFWDMSACNGDLMEEMDRLFMNACPDEVIDDEAERTDDGSLKRPAAFVSLFCRNLKKIERYRLKGGCCPQFADYPFEQFHSAAGAMVEGFLSAKTGRKSSFRTGATYPEEVMAAIAEPFEKALYTAMSTCIVKGSTELIFAGFGEDEEYPALVPVIVNDGYDFHVRYHVETEKIVHISDETPVAICPFAQKDVTESILQGMHSRWKDIADIKLDSLFYPSCSGIYDGTDGLPALSWDVMDELFQVRTDDLLGEIRRSLKRTLAANQKEWERNLRDYGLKSMAELAESLIDLTGFHRILNFEQEGVGGPVDLAVISKADGFSWLNRKSWYHHKDTDGMHGKFGI